MPADLNEADRERVCLLQNNTPILDVRAPVEFEQGALPGSTNLPILNDEERAAVGTAYKEQGSTAATVLGHQLVSGRTKDQRLAAWLRWHSHHASNESLSETPHEQSDAPHIMCWRGGQRSRITQQWLAEAGCPLPCVPGGYKAMRQLAIHILQHPEHYTAAKQWWVVAGRTGTGKTVVIEALDNAIDLEGVAVHRGSAFGARQAPQPTPATFENTLAAHYIRHAHDTLVLEDESRTIGRMAVPEVWHARMQQAPLALIEATVDERAAHIAREYIDEPLEKGVSADLLHHRYADALRRITRRLGGSRAAGIKALLDHAFQGEMAHSVWIEALLTDYYDPMYDYQIASKQARVKFTGNREEVLGFLREIQHTGQ